MIRNLLAAIGFVCVAMAGTAAVYATRWYDNDVARLAVSTLGLDLTTPEGQRTLDRRVSLAASRVCSSSPGSFSYYGYSDRTCRRDAIAGAEPQIRRAIQRAFDRRGYAYVEDMMQPDAYDPTPIAPEPYYREPPRPMYREPTYVQPTNVETVQPGGEPILREKRTTITRTPLKSRVKWVRLKNGKLRKVIVRRKLVRKTVTATYTR